MHQRLIDKGAVAGNSAKLFTHFLDNQSLREYSGRLGYQSSYVVTESLVHHKSVLLYTMDISNDHPGIKG